MSNVLQPKHRGFYWRVWGRAHPVWQLLEWSNCTQPEGVVVGAEEVVPLDCSNTKTCITMSCRLVRRCYAVGDTT
jgi:hypothetical protein